MRRLFHGWIGLIGCIGCAGTTSLPSGSEPDGPNGASGAPATAADPNAADPNAADPNEPSGTYWTDPAADSVNVELAAADLGEVGTRLTSALGQSASSLAAASTVSHRAELGYDPRSAAGLELINESELGLNAAELGVLAERGFVILPRQAYPSFPYGYAAIYAADLPVFISADMVLEAVHRSYDSILARLEASVLLPELGTLLSAMRARLAQGAVALDADTKNDADLFLTLAQSLLEGRALPPDEPGLSERTSELFGHAMAANGEQSQELFGAARRIDFSQFEPRGHYLGDESLERYFRSMMWLGRLDLRLIETLENGDQVFRPRQLKAALSLKALMDDETLAAWKRIDSIIGMFVGEHDAMTLPELDELLQAVGVADAAALSGVTETRIAEAIIAGQFGEQRIASQIIRRGPGRGTLPLDSSFAFLGQRYTVDSHVFSNVVYDRVGEGKVARVVPNALDVAYAALGNDQAVALLATELNTYAYAGDLAGMRELTDSHPEGYWQSSLYTSWLSALRSLSPRAGGTALEEPGLPEVAQTEAWGRRVLNTQLASWAQLRHDTLLYAKQSYTAGSLCEFPDVYVDPYPEFFHGISRFAEVGRATADAFGAEIGTDAAYILAAVREYFERLGSVSATLAEMAELQRTGEPHSQEHLDFINQAVQIQTSCDGSDYQTGWYTGLFFNSAKALELDPTIADVHTDPGGPIPVSRPASVLHVATGTPRLMVMTRESCQGPRAYAGVVFSYHEKLAEGLTRQNDDEWKAELTSGAAPAEVPWIGSLLAGADD